MRSHSRFAHPGLAAVLATLALALAPDAGPLGPAEARAQEDFPAVDDDAGDDDFPAAREYFSIGVRGGIWLARIGGEIRLAEDVEDAIRSQPGAADIIPTRIDLEDDLDVDETELVPWVELFITLKYVNIYVSYWQVRYEGEETIERQLQFGPLTFDVNERVETDIEIISAAAKVQVNPISFDYIEAGIILGVRYFHFDASLETANPGRESYTLDAPIPLVGLALSLFFGPVEVAFKGAGMVFDTNDLDVRYFEGEATIGVALPVPVIGLGIGAGYFFYYADIEDEDENEADVRLHGPMTFVRLRF